MGDAGVVTTEPWVSVELLAQHVAPDGSVLDDAVLPSALVADSRDPGSLVIAIDAAVFGLKAVSPNAVAAADDRTSAEIIASIEAQLRIVTQTPEFAGALLKDDVPVRRHL
jgi:hypothetical protein